MSHPYTVIPSLYLPSFRAESRNLGLWKIDPANAEILDKLRMMQELGAHFDKVVAPRMTEGTLLAK